MEVKLGSWWQRRKRLSAIVAIATIFAGMLVPLILTGYGYTWTGFFNKTLWDWLQLFIIPVVFGIGGFWLNQIQKEREERAAEQRAESERKAAEQQAESERKAVEQRAESERKAAEQWAQTEREIASDNQREATLQAYIDKLAELLLEKRLRNSAKDDEVRTIARVRTLTVLSRLDEKRKKSVLQFLHESNLIDKEKGIIDLSGADLSGTNLAQANLSGANLVLANLSGTRLRLANLNEANLRLANLSGANLKLANLSGANLDGTNLSGASLWLTNLSGANLSRANLDNTNLSGANLDNANLRGANLDNANLSGANLKDASVTLEILKKQARSLQNTTMPDGTTHS